MESQLEIINEEINKQLSTKEVTAALVATTFKGFTPVKMKQAVMEGMMRGFTFKDFLEKNVYAIPYGDGYSLVTSIDFVRKVAMRSGLVGKSEPKFVENNSKIENCTITVKRSANGVIGEYTATVYFDEYNTKRNQWITKPHTMIAKVAEMHALRSAFPEEMAKQYVEEEMEREIIGIKQDVKVEDWQAKLKAIKSASELKSVWASMPQQAKSELKGLKDMLKEEYPDEDTNVSK